MDDEASQATGHVLVVDDDASICKGLTRLLRAAGLCATFALGGAEALERLKDHAFTVDLVLLDVSMPTMDGFEVLRQVRADPRTADLPVILFSASADPLLRERAIAAGANDHWVKMQSDLASLPRRLKAYMNNER